MESQSAIAETPCEYCSTETKQISPKVQEDLIEKLE